MEIEGSAAGNGNSRRSKLLFSGCGVQQFVILDTKKSVIVTSSSHVKNWLFPSISGTAEKWCRTTQRMTHVALLFVSISNIIHL